jgi:hypothetical protein
MSDKKENGLILISYLISETEEGKIVGYSTLSERLYYLREKMSDRQAENFPQLVNMTDDGLNWEELREFLTETVTEGQGSAFININTSKVDERNRWMYEFESKAPKEVLDDKLGSIVSSESTDNIKRKINSAATEDNETVIEEVYPTNEN